MLPDLFFGLLRSVDTWRPKLSILIWSETRIEPGVMTPPVSVYFLFSLSDLIPTETSDAVCVPELHDDALLYLSDLLKVLSEPAVRGRIIQTANKQLFKISPPTFESFSISSFGVALFVSIVEVYNNSFSLSHLKRDLSA